MSEPFLGEIRAVGFNFAPQGWALCNGQTLPIAQNQALFALLGTTYGGNGQTTFNLPDLQGRSMIHAGNGTGLPAYVQGQKAGAVSVTLQAANLPAHAHPYSPAVSSAGSDQSDPIGAIPAVPSATTGRGATPTFGYTKSTSTGAGLTQQTGSFGSSQPVATLPPYLAIYYIIALQGIFPSHS